MSEYRDQIIEKLHQIETLTEVALNTLINEAETSDNLDVVSDTIEGIIGYTRFITQSVDLEYRMLRDIERSEKSLGRELNTTKGDKV